MTDTTTKPEVVKQAPTAATYQRTATVGATAIIGPNLVQPILSYGFEIVKAFSPTFPVPSDGVLWSAATIICGGAATLFAYYQRGTRLANRATD